MEIFGLFLFCSFDKLSFPWLPLMLPLTATPPWPGCALSLPGSAPAPKGLVPAHPFQFLLILA
jgi:hypothetical protein